MSAGMHGEGSVGSRGFMGLATLMQMALAGEDLTPVSQQLLARAEANPGDANAMLDLAIVLELLGQTELSRSIQHDALQHQQVYRLPANTEPPTLRLMAVVAPGELMANTPVEFLVKDSDVSLDLLYVGEGIPAPAALPPHDLLFVGVGESVRNDALLHELDQMIEGWPRPVLNRPARVAQLSRDGARRLLDDVGGIDMPAPVRVDRGALEALGRGEVEIGALLSDGGFPLIVRPIDSHAGRGLARLDEPGAIAPYLNSLADGGFYLARYVDYAGSDGRYRKYRIVLIDGRPFPVHMAISDHWMIHYLNAGMAEDAAKRAEEERFMADFDMDFAARHGSALAAISEVVGLDYFGLDCAETRDGRLLIFELDSALVVHAMDPVDIFPYKQPAMRQLFAAFRQLLLRRAGHGTP